MVNESSTTIKAGNDHMLILSIMFNFECTAGPTIHVPFTLMKSEDTSPNSVLWFAVSIDKFLAILTIGIARNLSLSISNWR